MYSYACYFLHGLMCNPYSKAWVVVHNQTDCESFLGHIKWFIGNKQQYGN